MSDETDIDEGWDALIEGQTTEPAPAPAAAKPSPPRPSPPASAARPSAGVRPPSLVSQPKPPSLAPPPGIASKPKPPSLAPPPSLAGKPKAFSPSPPPTTEARPSTPTFAPPRQGQVHAAGPHAASVKAGAPRLAPPPTVAPRPVAALGLPPPPEFLPRASSAELPLENEVRDDSGMIDVGALVRTSTTADVSDRLELDALRLDLEPTHVPAIADEGSPVDASQEDEAAGRLEIGEPVALHPKDGHGPAEPLELPVDSLPIEAPVELQAGDSFSIEAPVELQAGDSMEVDIEVSNDALPRLAHESGAPPARSKPYPARLPATPGGAADEAAQAPAASPSLAARPRTASFAEILPTASPRPLGPWLTAAVVAVLAVVVIAWLVSGGEDERMVEAKPAAADTKAADASSPKPTEPAQPEPAPTEPEPTPTEPEPTPTEPEPAKPRPPIEPEATAPSRPPHDPEASIIRVEPDTSAYDRAAADYEATGSQQALLTMTTAACAINDGPKARAAFRKLLGRTLRTEAIVECRKTGVDVMSNVEGHTGPELLAQARNALEAGDAQTAFDKAFASNKVERSSEAVLVQGLAACTLGDGDKAQRLMPHISKKARPKLVDGCKAHGIELRP